MHHENHPLRAGPSPARDGPSETLQRIQAEELSRAPFPDRLRAADVITIRA